MRDDTATRSLSGVERVRADAEARGLEVDIVVRPRAHSLDEAAALLGIEASQIVKTIVVKRHDGDFLFVLVPGGRRISWPKLRALLGVNKLSLPHADVALEATGYERGTITPLGSSTAWPIFADSSILGARVALGAGDHGHSAFVDANAFVTAFGASFADVTDPE